MSEDIRRSLEPGDFTRYYSHEQFCTNCGRRNYAYLPKGEPVSGHTIECDNCGCGIRLRAYNAWT